MTLQRISRLPLPVAVFGALLIAAGIAGFILVSAASANHSSGDPMLYGWVKDSSSNTTSGANVQYCWDLMTQPTRVTCGQLTSSAGIIDDVGHWRLPSPAAGYYSFWAEKDGTFSQEELMFYDSGTGLPQIEVPYLILSTSGGGGAGGAVPMAPSPPILSPPPTETTIFLIWTDNATNEDSYLIERSLAGVESWTLLSTLSASTTTYADISVTLGTFYDYRVKACLSGVGCSGYGQIWSISADSGQGDTVPPMIGAISGYVYDLNGNSAGNIGVDIFGSGTVPWAEFTNGNGFYSVTGLPVGESYTVSVRPVDGSSPNNQIVIVTTTNPDVKNVDFWLPIALGGSNMPPGEFTITGMVRHGDGTGVSNAVVDAWNAATGAFHSTLMGGTGTYTLSVPCGTWDVKVRPDDSAVAVDWYYNGFDEVVTFGCSETIGTEVRDFTVISSTATVTGRVLLPNGSIPEPWKFFVNFGIENGPGFGGSVTDNGNFLFSGSPGLFRMGVYTDYEPYQRYALPDTGLIEVNPGSNNLGTFTLVERDASIEGFVRNASGAGVSGVFVKGHVPDGSGFADTETDMNGFYRLSLIAGTWEISVDTSVDSDYVIADSFRRVTVGSNQTIGGVDFTAIRADSAITGRVVGPNGGVVTNVDMWVYTEFAGFGVSPISGAFTMAVPAGTYTINAWVSPTSGYFSKGSKTVTVGDGQTASVDIEFMTADGGGRIEGRLVDLNGNTISGLGAEVGAGSLNNWIPGVYDKVKGTYSITVPPGGWYVGLDVFSDDYAARGSDDFFKIGAGTVVTHDFVLVRADAVLEVTAKRSDGSIFPYIGVDAGLYSVVTVATNLAEFADDFEVGFFGDTGNDGVARINVPAGTYYLRAFAPKSEGLISPPEQVVTIAAGSTKQATLIFRQPDATITGRVIVGDTGQPIDAFVGAYSATGGLVEAGTSSDGTYTLSVIGGDTWYVKAGGNVNGIFYEAAPVVVGVVAGAVVQQNILVKSTGRAIPKPFAADHNVEEPFASTLDDGMAVSIGANGFGTGDTVAVTIQPNIETAEFGGTNVIGIAYDIEARNSDGSSVSQLNGDIVIRIPYDDIEVLGFNVNEADMMIGFLDEVTNQWTRIGSTIVDTEANIATATADHLTRFALLTPAYASIVGPGISEGDLIRGPDGVKIWIVNTDGYKRHIFNPAVFGMYGHFVWDNIVEVPQTTLDVYKTSDLYRALGDGRVFALEEVDEGAGLANKRWLDMTPERFIQASYDWLQVFEINTVERDFYQEGTSIK